VVDAAVVDDAAALLAAVAAWARQRTDVDAAVVIGSHARVLVPADRWSDIDIVLVVDDPVTYAADAGWLAAFGGPLLTFTEPTAVGGFVEGGCCSTPDRMSTSHWCRSAAVEQIADHPDAAAVFGRGFRMLVDKIDLARVLRRCGPAAAPALPDAAAFGHVTHDFWYHALWTARKLRRGEIWIAKQSCDGYLKALAVRLLAWHTQAMGPGVDTWHDGRFLERWADRQTLQDLRASYASYDADDVARALWATVDLFERLERDCAERLDLPLIVAHREVRELLRAALG